jgi:hypothetical protein
MDSEEEGPMRRNTMKQPAESAKEVMKRFRQMRGEFALLPPNKFNSDTFARESGEYYAAYNIPERPVNEGASFSSLVQPRQNIMIKNVATFIDTTFFVEPGATIQDGCIYSVSTQEMAAIMKNRGYLQVRPTHITDIESLPHLPTTITAADSTPNSLTEMPAPAALTLPRNGRLPKLWVFAPEMKNSTAAAILYAFEVKVVDEDEKVVFSPYRLWTKDERKKAKLTGITHSRFTKYCQSYYWIREVKKAEPNDIEEKLTMSFLTSKAAEYAREKDWIDIDWYELAKEVAQTRMGDMDEE